MDGFWNTCLCMKYMHVFKSSVCSGLQKATNMAAWFNLFADLDPLSNPDAIGKDKPDLDAAL